MFYHFDHHDNIGKSLYFKYNYRNFSFYFGPSYRYSLFNENHWYIPNPEINRHGINLDIGTQYHFSKRWFIDFQYSRNINQQSSDTYNSFSENYIFTGVGFKF